MLKNTHNGFATPAILIITASFIIIIYGMLFVLGVQVDSSNRQIASERALNISEAGINYYKWHLAHDPDDFTDGTGTPVTPVPYGPFVHEYKDPQGTLMGYYSLEITPPQEGSTIVTIESTAWSDQYPKIKRKIKAQYGIPSMAIYSFLSNGSTWYGSGSVVNGKIHSNNGIRMDGTNTSIVSSAQLEYMCGSETGCHPPEPKDGVWGSGGDQALWQFPVPFVDFDSVAVDFSNMRNFAKSDGLYLDNSNADGYHLLFLSDGTVRINKVISTDYTKAYSVPGQGLGEFGIGGCRKSYQIIGSETFLGTYNVVDVPIIFAEDDLWIEGTVRGRLTVAAVDFPLKSSSSVIYIPNSIKYTAYDGSDVIGIVSQNDIYFTRSVPEEFQVDGVLLTQQGTIIRHGYFNWCGGTDEAVKQKLILNGSVISYFKSYWNFGEGPESGFRQREINYDTNVLYNPPPYFPTSGQYEFISWTEEKAQ
ncbi:MAG TPA: hypothetical protein VI819_04925 [Patescibacteria group bacterium]|nr:hypothetical protein [Patescibacteria group bacterium]